MSSIAFWMGTKGVLAFFLLTAVAGGGLALFYLLMQWRAARIAPSAKVPDGNSQPVVLPYGVAIAAGGLSTIWLTQSVSGGVM